MPTARLCSKVFDHLRFVPCHSVAESLKPPTSSSALREHAVCKVCELVGTFLLEKVGEICDKSNIGLYRDDDLSIFRNKSGTQLQKIKNKL